MELIRPFEKLNKGDAGIAGGKGASLGEMTQAGIPVPPGFVILADAFEQFLEEADLNQELDTVLDQEVRKDEMQSVEHASSKIQSLIMNAKMPEDIASEILKQFEVLDAEFVAVRSSATAEDSSSSAWAGQLDTFLNTTEESLLQNVQKCWASLFTPRAIFYRFEKGMHGDKISVAVVVQKMVQSEVSGIAFSVHPVTEDYNQMIIEAGFGLGEAIVSGQVTPDSYVIEKIPRRIIDKNITFQSKALVRGKDGGNDWRNLSEVEGNKPALSEGQAMELADIVLRIENHYGFPCDIEWAYEAGKFYITQSRPITTLTPKPTEGKSENPCVQFYLNTPLVKMGQWAVFPVDQEIWMTEHTARYFEKEFGISKGPLVILHKDPIWYSHIYFPVDFFPKLYSRIKEITDVDFRGLQEILLRFYDRKKEARKALAESSGKDLIVLSDDELAKLYERNRDLVHKIVIYDQFGWMAEEYWDQIMEDVLSKKANLRSGTPEYSSTLFALIKPREISSTLEEKRATLKAAMVVQSGKGMSSEAESLASEFGWMPVFAYGTPWDAAHYEKELLELTKKKNAELEKEYAALAQYSELRDLAIEEIRSRFKLTEEDLQPFIDYGLALDARNEAEYVVSWAGYYLLPIYEEIVRRLGITIDELRTLSEVEISACTRGSATPSELLVAKGNTVSWGFDAEMRNKSYFTEQESEILFNYAERVSKLKGQKSDVESEAGTRRGVTASPGKVKGVARIIPTPADSIRVGASEILITYGTTVDYLPAMKKAGAIVTEVGGLTCHAAVVSREFGIPCVVGIKNAMTIFKDGEMIEVDADKGVVRKI